jgi:hypothetical protein
MKDPFITFLETLRDAAPSISLDRLHIKSPGSGLCADLATDTDTPFAEFTYEKCQYKVYNTWEHFDYFIRNYKRLSRPGYGSNAKAQNIPSFRSRRQAESGFSAARVVASKIKMGDIIYTRETLQVSAICTENGKFTGLTVQQLGSLAINHFDADIVAKNQVYRPKSPVWFLLEEPPSPKALRLIQTYNPELFKLYFKLKAQSALIQSRTLSRLKERQRQEELRRAKIEAQIKTDEAIKAHKKSKRSYKAA